jgi:hypothetical protein
MLFRAAQNFSKVCSSKLQLFKKIDVSQHYANSSIKTYCSGNILQRHIKQFNKYLMIVPMNYSTGKSATASIKNFPWLKNLMGGLSFSVALGLVVSFIGQVNAEEEDSKKICKNSVYEDKIKQVRDILHAVKVLDFLAFKCHGFT